MSEIPPLIHFTRKAFDVENSQGMYVCMIHVRPFEEVDREGTSEFRTTLSACASLMHVAVDDSW